jgi:hypothetical protein
MRINLTSRRSQDLVYDRCTLKGHLNLLICNEDGKSSIPLLPSHVKYIKT